MYRQLIFGVVIPIFIGGLLYIGLRTEDLVMFGWFQTLHIDGTTGAIRDVFQQGTLLDDPNWMVYSLPGGLYMYSCVTMIMLIWDNYITKISSFWIFVVPVIGMISEPLQHSGHFPGTHDILDYICYIIGAMLPMVTYKAHYESYQMAKWSPLWNKHLLSAITVLVFFVLAFGADVKKSPLGEIVSSVFGNALAGY